MIVAAVLVFLAFRGMDIKKIFQNILHANIFWVIISALLSTIAFVVRAHRWNILIEPLGFSPRLKNTTNAVLIGYLANLGLPRLGEISRCGALNRSDNIPINKLLGTVIVERIVDVLSLIICILITSAIEYKRLGNFFVENIFSPLNKKVNTLISSPLLMLLLIIVILAFIVFLFYFRRKKEAGTDTIISRIIKGFADGLKTISILKRPVAFIFHSILIWFLYYLGVYVALFAFPFTHDLGAGASLFLLVAGGIGMSAPVQGGIGAYHLLVSQGLILYGLSKEEGLTFATMLHSLQILLIILFGTIALILLLTGSKKVITNKDIAK